MGWGMGGRFKREGTYVCLWLIHVVVGQKPTQYCKAIILHLKISFKNSKLKSNIIIISIKAFKKLSTSKFLKNKLKKIFN